ncbi:DNA sulfur modification protein DndB [Metabacillus fastidiosus]|uniref:DNA sulfur modification protein DndB n=1 Tax=Metabacillus fastidiosus TaxID=1458 RepID=UPI003D29A604
MVKVTESRDILELELIKIMSLIKDDDDKVNKVRDNLKEYKIVPGKVQAYFNNPSIEIPLLENDNLYLLTQQVYEVTNNENINPEKYFTEAEIKHLKTTYEPPSDDKIEFPYTFKGIAIEIREGQYLLRTDTVELKKIFAVLWYNSETQREGRQVKKNDDEIITIAKTHEKSVNEMETLFEKGEMESTTITLNARLGTSDIGEELIYDEENMKLTVTKGTFLDILDGFHRMSAIIRAMRKDPELNEPFELRVLNREAVLGKRFFKQINTFNPISKKHLRQMGDRQSNFITDQLKGRSELKGKIAPTGDRILKGSNLVVTLSTLSDAIDEIFKVNDRPTAVKVTNFLIEFFDVLLNSYPDEFFGDVSEYREISLINSNIMFYGYIQLAKRMWDKKINTSNLPFILSKIDFSRDNEIWKKNKVLSSNLDITTNAKKGIIRIFKNIEL